MVPLLLLLLLSLEAVSGEYKSSCPPKESIRPCSCLMATRRQPWIMCSGLSSLAELERCAKGMKGYSITRMMIKHSNLGRLPSDIFNDMAIQTLKIFSTNLTVLGDRGNRPPFVGLENSLEHLEINDALLSKTSPLASFNLAHLKKLSFLEMSDTFFPFIANEWFENGPYALKQLRFYASQTEILDSHVFANLVNLKQIAATGGTISEVSRLMFPMPAHHLSSISLSKNDLSSLPADIFHEMPSLEAVYLGENRFTEINEVSFSPVWNQLTHVYFPDNPINCDDEMKWVYKYRLPRVFSGSCAQPERLRLKELNRLTLKDFE